MAKGKRQVKPKTDKPKKAAPVGRPTGYDPKYVVIAKKMAEMGATTADLANGFGVAISTINLWMVTHSEFSDAIKAGRKSADERVEHSLYQRATGYECDETDIRVVDGAIAMTPIRKVYPPDTTAAIFWLKNRTPEEWRDKQAVEHSGPNGGPIETRNLDDDALKSRIAALVAKNPALADVLNPAKRG